MPREILQITPESTYGVYDDAGDHAIIDLPSDNAFTMRAAPNSWEIASAGSDNLIVATGTATTNCDGTLRLYGRPSQSALLASMISGITGVHCKTLPSYTIDHGIMIEDGTCSPVVRRYLGIVASGSFQLDSTSDQAMLLLWNLRLMGAKSEIITLVDFPIPPFTAYDYAEDPYTLQDAEGSILYDGVDITEYVESFSFDAANILTAFRGSARYRTRIGYFGRRPKITMKFLYYTDQIRVDFEAFTPKPIDITFTDKAGDTLEFNFGATNYIRTVEDDLKLADFHRETVTLSNTLDPATGVDMSITFTPHAVDDEGGEGKKARKHKKHREA